MNLIGRYYSSEPDLG